MQGREELVAPEFVYPLSLEPQPPPSGRGARQTSIFWISVTYFGQVEIAWPVILLMPVFSCLCMGAASDWAVTVLILVRAGASLVGARVTIPAYCAAARLERPMAAWLPMTAGSWRGR